MISVCIATYNGEKYIKEQLLSILPQLSENDEVIVSDDNSCDKTIDVINSLCDKRIKIYTHGKEPYKFLIDKSTHNFANALKYAKGDIIFLSDQDDKWVANKVNLMVNQLRSHYIVVSDCYVTDAQLNIIKESYFSIRKKTYGIWDTFWKSPFLGSCMAFRREVLEAAVPFPKYGVGHDVWLALVSIRKFDLSYIMKPLSYYRRHKDTVTISGLANNTTFLFKLRYRIFLLKAILFRLYIV